MFVVLTYDVNQKRVGRVLKVCRKYLVHVQKSVFEGLLTESKLEALKRDLRKVIDFDDDGICIYTSQNMNNVVKECIGVVEENSHIF